MALKFITGNKDKFTEIAKVLGEIPLEMVSIDLSEIQDIDAEHVLREKLLAARAHDTSACIVEDTSLYLDCLAAKLPGPFIKWFEKSIGVQGIYDLAERYQDFGAEVRTMIGYLGEDERMTFFEGKLRGIIVPPRGTNDFGFGPIFLPEGQTQTFGEMGREEKHALSMRGIAARKLRDFLKP